MNWNPFRKRLDSSPAPLKKAALEVVRAIEQNGTFRRVAKQGIRFCPRCGQIPVSDYRFEEAFSRLHAAFPAAKRSDINLAIEQAVKEIQ